MGGGFLRGIEASKRQLRLRAPKPKLGAAHLQAVFSLEREGGFTFFEPPALKTFLLRQKRNLSVATTCAGRRIYTVAVLVLALERPMCFTASRICARNQLAKTALVGQSDKPKPIRNPHDVSRSTRCSCRNLSAPITSSLVYRRVDSGSYTAFVGRRCDGGGRRFDSR